MVGVKNCENLPTSQMDGPLTAHGFISFQTLGEKEELPLLVRYL